MDNVEHFHREDARAFLELAAALGVAIPAQLPGELDALLGRLQPAGQFALLHGDPCPDNAVPTSDGIRFIDLEQAALGNNFTELAYLRIGFPTCWCAKSVPDPERRQAEAAYESTWRALTGSPSTAQPPDRAARPAYSADELGQSADPADQALPASAPGHPAGQPADPGRQLADACAGWLIRGDTLFELAGRGLSSYLTELPDRDWRWGTATARQRLLHRLTVVAAVAADQPELTNLAGLCQLMCDRMVRRWPAIRPLPVARRNPLDDP